MNKTKLKDCCLLEEWGTHAIFNEAYREYCDACPNRGDDPEERTTDWYMDKLPGDIKISDTSVPLHVCKHWATGEYRVIYTSGWFQSELFASYDLTEALKKLYNWCVEQGHIKEEI